MNRRTRLVPPAAGRDEPDRWLRQRGQPHRRPGQPRQAAVPGHLAGHRHRNLGGRGDGRLGRQPQQLLAAIRPPRRSQHMAAGHPARGSQQRRPDPRRHAAQGQCWPGSGPARTCPTPRSPPPKNNGKAWSPGLLDAALAETPDALAADPASGRLLALLTNGTTDISSPGGTAWTPLVTRPALAAIPGRYPVPSGQPHRGRVQPLRAAHARRGLRPSRHRRDLRPHRPDMAAGRPRTPRRLRTPGHHRAPAHHHRRHHHGPANRRNRIGGTPARRLVHRQRRPLGTVTAAAAQRRHADLGVPRAR